MLALKKTSSNSLKKRTTRRVTGEGVVDMYTLTHRIAVSDTSSGAITNALFFIGLRYSHQNGDYVDHLLATPKKHLKVSYVPISESLPTFAE